MRFFTSLEINHRLVLYVRFTFEVFEQNMSLSDPKTTTFCHFSPLFATFWTSSLRQPHDLTGGIPHLLTETSEMRSFPSFSPKTGHSHPSQTPGYSPREEPLLVRMVQKEHLLVTFLIKLSLFSPLSDTFMHFLLLL